MMIEERIEALTKWGKSITLNLDSAHYQSAFEEAASQNPWFIHEFVRKSISSLAASYLNEEKLHQWTGRYDFQTTQSAKRIALVMAGNIPLVGFHDLLSVIITGHHALVKLSSKDQMLLPLLLNDLEKVSPELRQSIIITKDFEGFDAAIATGSDNSAMHFRYLYGNVPHIIRRNRNSIAILSGNENPEELSSLNDDIFLYFGLGCRNVSKILIPENYDFEPLLNSFSKYPFVKDHPKYQNNYKYYRSIFTVNKEDFIEHKCILLKENHALSSPLAVLYYEHYSSPEDIRNRIALCNDQIQIIVGNNSHIYQSVPFGKSQNPELWEYADQVDTIEFLLNQ